MGGRGEEKEGVTTGSTYCSWYLIGAIWRQFAVLLCELGKCIKVIDQTDIITFHRDTCGNENTPRDRLRISSDTL